MTNIPIFLQKTLKNALEKPSVPGLLLFFMFIRALVNSDIVMSPSSSLESLSISFGRFVSFKYSLRFISDSGSSLLLFKFS